MAIVYRHWRKDKNEVFYVGIGKGDSRAFDVRNRSSVWKGIKNRTGVDVEIVARDLDWATACELETLMIQEYGRFDLGTGRLVNMTDGGDGTLNFFPSKETREKMRNSALGKKKSEQARLKTSEARKGSGNGMFGKIPHNASKVYCGYLNKEFNTATACAKELGISQSHISCMMAGKTENIYNISRI
jgi:hypothetical protein